MIRRMLIFIALATVACTTSTPPSNGDARCPDAATPTDTARPLDTAPDTAADSGPDADADAGSSCPGILLLAPVALPTGPGHEWEFCENETPAPLLKIAVFRNGILERETEVSCLGDTIHLGSFAPGRLHIAASYDCYAAGRDLTEPEACAHEPDESRPFSCTPAVVELAACQTQFVPLALAATAECFSR